MSDLDTITETAARCAGDPRKDLRPAADRVRPGRRLIASRRAAAAEDLPGQLAMPARPGCLDELQDGCTVRRGSRKDLRPAADRVRPGRRLIVCRARCRCRRSTRAAGHAGPPGCWTSCRTAARCAGDLRKGLRPAADRVRPGRRLIACRARCCGRSTRAAARAGCVSLYLDFVRVEAFQLYRFPAVNGYIIVHVIKAAVNIHRPFLRGVQPL